MDAARKIEFTDTLPKDSSCGDGHAGVKARGVDPLIFLVTYLRPGT